MYPNIFETDPQTRGNFGFYPHPSREYSDHVLSDIGLSRSQINAAVYVPTVRRARDRKARTTFGRLFALMTGAVNAACRPMRWEGKMRRTAVSDGHRRSAVLRRRPARARRGRCVSRRRARTASRSPAGSRFRESVSPAGSSCRR